MINTSNDMKSIDFRKKAEDCLSLKYKSSKVTISYYTPLASAYVFAFHFYVREVLKSI